VGITRNGRRIKWSLRFPLRILVVASSCIYQLLCAIGNSHKKM
jgi:hypothetical protein